MYKIQDFSELTGISKRMLRYLEEQGLLCPVRMENEYRVYSSQHLDEVRWIQFWQKLGFSFNQIKTLKKEDPIKIEELILNLFKQKKLEFEESSIQLQTIRNVISIIKDKQIEAHSKIQHAFDSIKTLSTHSREEFFSQLNNSETIIYGKFVEIENFFSEMKADMASKNYSIELVSTDIMKANEAIKELPHSELLVWQRTDDYFHFGLCIPENLINENYIEEFEEKLFDSFKKSLDKVFYEGELNKTTRLFFVSDYLQYIACKDIVFKMTIEIPSEKQQIYLLIPFQFIQAMRNNQSAETSILSRSLNKAMHILDNQKILLKSKTISNEDYLLSILLANSKTRYKMMSSLSSEAKELINKDISDLINRIHKAWQL